MHTRRRAVGLVVGFTLLGCAGSSSSTGTVDGGDAGSAAPPDAALTDSGAPTNPDTGTPPVTGASEIVATINGKVKTFSGDQVVFNRVGTSIVYTAMAGTGDGALTVTFPGAAPGTFMNGQNTGIQYAPPDGIGGGSSTASTIVVTEVSTTTGGAIKGTFSGQVKTFAITAGRFSVKAP